MRSRNFLPVIAGSLLLTGCLQLKVAAPTEPITINMNVKIEHEIQIRVDKDVEALLRNHSDLF